MTQKGEQSLDPVNARERPQRPLDIRSERTIERDGVSSVARAQLDRVEVRRRQHKKGFGTLNAGIYRENELSIIAPRAGKRRRPSFFTEASGSCGEELSARKARI